MKQAILLILFIAFGIASVVLAVIALAHRDLALMLIAFACAMMTKIIPEIAR